MLKKLPADLMTTLPNHKPLIVVGTEPVKVIVALKARRKKCKFEPISLTCLRTTTWCPY